MLPIYADLVYQSEVIVKPSVGLNTLKTSLSDMRSLPTFMLAAISRIFISFSASTNGFEQLGQMADLDFPSEIKLYFAPQVHAMVAFNFIKMPPF